MKKPLALAMIVGGLASIVMATCEILALYNKRLQATYSDPETRTFLERYLT